MGGIDTSLRERGGDPLETELDAARQKIGELSVEIELLRLRCPTGRPVATGRSRN